MKICASYQIQCWQTVFCFEIHFFAKRQTVSGQLKTTYKRQTTQTKIVKQGIIILTILFFLSSCCGLLCEREKHAEMIIEKVEAYRQKTGKLPENVTEVGIDDNQDHLSFYVKKSDYEYEIWYGLGLGTSKIYNSNTKKWREEG